MVASTASQSSTVARAKPAHGPSGLTRDRAYPSVYARVFGWDTGFEALVARIAADYAGEHDPGREAAWIAEVDGRRAGCIFCVAGEATTAELRILLVDPVARGHGLGGRLVATCVDFARAAGYRRIGVVDQRRAGVTRRIYQAAGFVLLDREPHHSFGRDLVGQHWARDL